MSSLSEMPELILENIIGLLDFRSVLTLRQVCRDFRNFIDDLNDSRLPDSKIAEIEIHSENIDENKIMFDFLDSEHSHYRIEYSESENSRKFGEKTIILENSNIVDVMARDLEFVLKFQKNDLECLSFCFDDSDVEDTLIHNLAINLKNLFHVSNRKIKARKFTVKTHHQSQIMSVLPFADPEALEFIDFYSVDNYLEIEINEVVKTEQWKKAKGFNCEFRLLNLNGNDFCHFSSCAIRTYIITAEDLDFWKKVLNLKFEFL
ncbi:hypothetical protein B9Z55_021268 [Caenorhabditis nigoni]|uniref:F-box domain-containing protein n=1 Tax=Caenorhabditis nigoni TaxID=1611254 RepID=A0A2G5TRU4_9PELO|nr:hypothetical protein B9Z55_021268 [Caenorhabditis nigoni]